MKKTDSLNVLHNTLLPEQKPKKRYCRFCKLDIKYIDYKNRDFLMNFINPQAKILPTRYTGNCDTHQRRVASTIKRARQMAIIPYTD